MIKSEILHFTRCLLTILLKKSFKIINSIIVFIISQLKYIGNFLNFIDFYLNFNDSLKFVKSPVVSKTLNFFRVAIIFTGNNFKFCLKVQQVRNFNFTVSFFC